MAKPENAYRIVYSPELNSTFIRDVNERAWLWYAGRPRAYHPMVFIRKLDTGAKVGVLIDYAIQKLGTAMDEFFTGLHPLAPYKHLAKYDDKKGTWHHECGIDYTKFQTVRDPMQTNCPVCLAIVEGKLRDVAANLDPVAVKAAREYVENVRQMNALGKQVVGEDVKDY